jgi:hypothetical protein
MIVENSSLIEATDIQLKKSDFQHLSNKDYFENIRPGTGSQNLLSNHFSNLKRPNTGRTSTFKTRSATTHTLRLDKPTSNTGST